MLPRGIISKDILEDEMDFRKFSESPGFYFLSTKLSNSPTQRPRPSTMLIDSWVKLLSEQLVRGYEHNDEFIEIKEKVQDLSLNLESLKTDVLSCKECIKDLCTEFSERPLVKETRLYDIAEDLEVIEPISVIIEQTEDECVVSVPEIEVFAVGTGEYEAIIKLKSAIKELYSELLDTPNDELGIVPLSWKRMLNRVIRKNGQT